MTPKDKAKELVDKYLCIDEIYNVDLFCDECGMSNDAAKYCALIAVDELIIEKNKWENGSFYTSKYWDYVKQEIKKL
jgi:hypothetical protein